MLAVQERLKSIIEGDVIDFNLHNRERNLESEHQQLQTKLNETLDGLARTIAFLSRKKESGEISNDEYMTQMKQLEAKRDTIIDYRGRMTKISQELEEIRKNKRR